MQKMTDEEYFAAYGLSNSDFRLLKESPLHLTNKQLFKLEGMNLTIGSAVHKLVLEPDEFNDVYVVEEFKGCELNKNSKSYKDSKQKWLDTAGKREVLSVDEFEKITLMARNVKAIAGGLLQNGVAERAFFADIDEVPCKCKADYFRKDARVAFDLKTTKSIKDFDKSVLEYGYAHQAAFYSDVISNAGYAVDRFVFILVESSKPYMVSVREMRSDSIEEGRAIYSKYLTEWKAYKNGAIPNVVKTTGLPNWYMEKVRGEI